MIVIAASIAIALLAATLALGTYRLIAGPHLTDRVIALDLIAVMAIGLMACLVVLQKELILLDASLVLALLAFLGTVAFARYMERES